MKINLLLDNPGDVRSGYLNVDPFASKEAQDSRTQGDLANLSSHVDAGEAEELVALEILDLFPAKDADRVLEHWLSRLAYGATITLSVIDVKEVARGILSGNLSSDDTNELLHGKQEKQWQFRKASFSLGRLVDVLKSHGYKILARRVQNYRAIVTAQRPINERE